LPVHEFWPGEIQGLFGAVGAGAGARAVARAGVIIRAAGEYGDFACVRGAGFGSHGELFFPPGFL